MANWQLFIRHAHRDNSADCKDNGLTEKGRKQGLALVEYLEKAHPDRKPQRILSSAKLRCRETAEFVAAWAGVKVEIDPRLMEQKERESDRDFHARVEQFIRESTHEHQCCFVSHGDLLPMVLYQLGDQPTEIKKGDLFWVVNGRIEESNAIQKSGIKL